VQINTPSWSAAVTEAVRRRRSDKRERTRAALIQAAARLIGRVGYDRLTMEAVAEAAGVTRRTVYGHFANKTELIIAAVVDRWSAPAPQPAPGASLEEHLRSLGPVMVAAVAARRARAVHAATFEAYALTHEEVRQATLAQVRDIYERIETGMRAAFDAEEFPMPPQVLVRLLDALIEGLTRRRAVLPEVFGDEVILAAFDALARLSARKAD
jgi:AcrR family transcriptional regulator